MVKVFDMQKDGLKTIDNDSEKKLNVLKSKRIKLDTIIKKLENQKKEKLSESELELVHLEINKYNGNNIK